MKKLTTSCLVLLSLCMAPAFADEIVTACDLVAGHPLDPDRLSPGIPTRQVMQNLDEAERICRRDLANDVDNARLNYNLGRVLFYGERYEEGFAYITTAAASGHRQAQFVEGLIRKRGQEGAAEADVCATLSLWLDAALRGHFAARLSLARDYLADRFATCKQPLNRDELHAMIVAASGDATDFFQRLLIDLLKQELSSPE